MIAYVLKNKYSKEYVARGTGRNNRALQLRPYCPLLYVNYESANLALKQCKIPDLEIKKIQLKEI